MQHLIFLGREVKKLLMELFMMLCILQNICTKLRTVTYCS